MKLKLKHVLQLGTVAVLVTALGIGNSIVLEPTLAQNITGLQPLFEEWLGFSTSAGNDATINASRAEGQELSKDIVKEGSVLVKNNGVLPLDYGTTQAVNVFGHAAIDWVYGGSGSGQVVPENNNAAENIDFLKALEMYEVEYNTELTKMYRNFAAPVGDIGSIGTFYDSFYQLTEPSITDPGYYTASLLANAKAFSDTAFVVIGRHAGETEDPTRVQYKAKTKNDMDRHYLEISTEEEALLTYVGENYENVVVIVNSTNTMELDFVETIPGIDACLVVGATGTRAAEAIPCLLYGETSPSGHFADTYAYDMASNVNFKRTSKAGIGHYTNASELYPTGASCNAGEAVRSAPAFIDYIEGVYLGYKWYETADAEGIWNSYTREVLDAEDNKVTLTGYDSVVQYPFGFGMSYTQFKWTVESVSVEDGSTLNSDSEITIQVRVENVGEYAGKDVVEVYFTPEYKDGGIEKAAVNLLGFAKTQELEPGLSEVLTIKFDAYDLASYDAYDLNKNGNKGYELDAGAYEIKLMTDSHCVKTVDFAGKKDVPGVITYNVASIINFKTDDVTGAEVSNKFTGEDTIQGVSLDGSDSNQDIGFITRAAFPDPYEVPAVADREMTTEAKKYNEWTNADAAAWDNATTDRFGNAVDTSAVTWDKAAGTLEYNGVSYESSVGSDGKAKVYKDGAVTELGLLLGSDYDNPLWDAVLDQITLAEARTVVLSGSFGNAAIDSVGKPHLSDYDGPAQVRSFNGGSKRGTGFPCSTVLAQTWNPSLAYSFGLNYGKEMNTPGIAMDGTYGFGANLHRSPWGGRNYEYLSEDGVLSAIMLAEEVRGLKNTGKYCYLKHLVLYETEHERDSMYTWCNEQALREIYLRPFKSAIQDGGCVGIMSSYNRIGNVWTGGSEALINGIIRDEYGFRGTIVTDYVDSWSQGFMSIESAVRAGGDILLGSRNSALDTGYDDSNRIQARVKEVCHHVLYTFLSARYTNSIYNAQDDVEQIIVGSVVETWEWWKLALLDLDILVCASCFFWVYFIFRDVVTGSKVVEVVEDVEVVSKKEKKKKSRAKKSGGEE